MQKKNTNEVSFAIALMIFSILLLSIMDGISKYLSQHYNVIAINIILFIFNEKSVKPYLE